MFRTTLWFMQSHSSQLVSSKVPRYDVIFECHEASTECQWLVRAVEWEG